MCGQCFERVVKAPRVLSGPPHPPHIDLIALIRLLMPVFCPAGCDTVTPEREEMKSTLRLPSMRTSQASVVQLVLGLYFIPSQPPLNLIWSEVISGQGKERHVISV